MTSTIRSLKLEWTDPQDIEAAFQGQRTLAILRDPIKRFISSYSYIRQIGTVQKSHLESVVRPLSPDTEQGLWDSPLLEGAEFYLKELEGDGFFDSHNLPQIWWLDEKYGEEFRAQCPTDYHNCHQHLGRIHARSLDKITHFAQFENLNQELVKIAGTAYTIQHINPGNSANKNLLQSFVKQNASRIEKLYQRDFDLYKKFILDK
jgi:hypothetical protein